MGVESNTDKYLAVVTEFYRITDTGRGVDLSGVGGGRGSLKGLFLMVDALGEKFSKQKKSEIMRVAARVSEKRNISERI